MCKFCDELKEFKAMRNGHRVDGVKTYYKVALVVEDFRNRNLCGKLTFRPHKFKYCPECGKEIK